MCRKCQASSYNRRIIAYFIDSFVITVPIYALAFALGGLVGSTAAITVPVALLTIATPIVFYFRDPIFGGAALGKRAMGLRVVSARDGVTPVTYGQALVRNVALLIPFFNLVDLTVPYRDPLCRRYGDRWAKTRVVETQNRLEERRTKVRSWLAQKGVDLQQAPNITPEQFARIAG